MNVASNKVDSSRGGEASVRGEGGGGEGWWGAMRMAKSEVKLRWRSEVGSGEGGGDEGWWGAMSMAKSEV